MTNNIVRFFDHGSSLIYNTISEKLQPILPSLFKDPVVSEAAKSILEEINDGNDEIPYPKFTSLEVQNLGEVSPFIRLGD